MRFFSKSRNFLKFDRIPRGEAGFSLMEITIAAGLSLVLGLAAASIQVYQTRGVRVASVQANNVALAGAIRTQLSRREKCLNNFALLPNSFSSPSPIGVKLSSSASDVAQAGADLKNWKLIVQGLDFTNVTYVGQTDGGNALYAGDILLQTQGDDVSPSARTQFKQTPVAHINFELSGTTPVACYTSDVYSDNTQQLASACASIFSGSGQAGSWQNGKCVVGDPDAATMCGMLGETWDAATSTCMPDPQTSCAALGENYVNGYCQPQLYYNSKSLDAFSPPGLSLTCPAGRKVVGGACTASGNTVPLNTFFDTNTQSFLCGWTDTGTNTSNVFIIQIVCL